MAELVKTLKEVANWFLNNSSGTVTCVREDDERLVVYSYDDAREFFDTDVDKVDSND